MKKYFEFPVDKQVRDDLTKYYQDLGIEQHSEIQELKTELKLFRIKKLIKFNKEDLILDVGCSTGYFLKKIANDINQGVGLDISTSAVAKANRSNKFANINFFSFDGTTIHQQKKFSKVFLIDVLEHVFYPEKLLKNIYNVLSAKGMIVIKVPFSGFVSELFTKRYHQGHLRYYDPDYLVQYLRKQGFKTVSISTYNSVPLSSYFIKIKYIWNLLNFFVNLVPSAIYPYFGEIIVTAEKI